MESSQPQNFSLWSKSSTTESEPCRNINGKETHSVEPLNTMDSKSPETRSPMPLSPMSPATEAMLCEASIEAEEQSHSEIRSLQIKEKNGKSTHDTIDTQVVGSASKLTKTDEMISTLKDSTNSQDSVDQCSVKPLVAHGDNIVDSLNDALLKESNSKSQGDGSSNDEIIDKTIINGGHIDTFSDTNEVLNSVCIDPLKRIDSVKLKSKAELDVEEKTEGLANDHFSRNEANLAVNCCDVQANSCEENSAPILEKEGVACDVNKVDRELSKSSEVNKDDVSSLKNCSGNEENGLCDNFKFGDGLSNKRDIENTVSEDSCTLSNNVNASENESGKEELNKSLFVQPVFEDITEDEDSGEEEMENIDLDLETDDLIDPGSSCSGNDKDSDKAVTERNDVEKQNSDANDKVILRLNIGLNKDHSSQSSKTKGMDAKLSDTNLKNNQNLQKDVTSQPSAEFINASGGKRIADIQFTENINSTVVPTVKPQPPKKAKFTARKSGKPIRETEAPLKTINLYPFKNVTMKVEEIGSVLEINLPKEKILKTENLEKSNSNFCSDSAPNKVSGIKKKRGRRNTYNFPGFRKAKKLKLTDDLGSSCSSAESLLYSDGDYNQDSESKDTPSLDSSNDTKTSASSTSGSGNSALLYFLSKPSSLPSTPSSQSSSPAPTLTAEGRKSISPEDSSPSSNKLPGNKKMKSVLDMLHERNRLKAQNEEVGLASGDFVASTTTSETGFCNSVFTSTATTTTYIVSPPPDKPIIETNAKRKGTPRKRKEDVICVSDSDDDGPSNHQLEGKQRKDSYGNPPVLYPATAASSLGPANIHPKPVNTSVQSTPLLMVVSPTGNSPPGLRSLLPRPLFPTTPTILGGKVPVQLSPAQGVLGTSLPYISPLPMGAKSMNMTNMPAGMVPMTSLPGAAPQTVTFFTTVPTSQGMGTVPVTFAGTNFVALPGSIRGSSPPTLNSKTVITSPSQTLNAACSLSSLSSTSLSLSSLSQSSPSAAQISSDSLRSLLVGKSQNMTNMNVGSLMSSSQMSSPPLLVQMVPSTAGNFFPVATGPPVTLGSATSIPAPIKTSVAEATSQLSTLRSSYSLIKPHTSSVPNGVTCLTPPKTPTSDGAYEKAVAATLTRPISGQVEDSDVIPLCSCKISGTSYNKLSSPVTYCQALDSVDNKILGCCNKVTNAQLVRPGVKIPFMAVCEVHRKRLRLHQCCPGCGHFCSQGKFHQCKKEGKSSVHNFHKQCMFYRGGKYYCPHCGEETSQCEVELRLSEDKKPEELKLSSRTSKERRGARILPDKNFIKSKSTNEPQIKAMKQSGKPVSLDTNFLGPDQQVLNRLNRCVSEDRPKKYRNIAKDLYTPASEGDMEKVFYLLVDGMDPNMRYEMHDDQTALHAAATLGHMGTLFLLQQFGGETHAQDKSLRTPMMCAAENGHLRVIQFLIKVGAKVGDRGEDGMTSLHYAAKAGHIDIIQHILETKQIDVNVEDDGGWTPIIWATESLLVDVVKYLLSQGGDPNKKDNEENTGLHWAAYSGSLEIAEMYVELGCEIDTPNEHGDRALHIAARQDHYDIVVLLLARGADVNTKNNKDVTPLEACVNKNGPSWMSLKVNQQLRSFAARKLIQPEKLLERDMTMGREKNPIACVNAEDSQQCPSDFLYIVENVETSPLNINCVITSLQSCRCKDDCSSMYCVCGRSSVKCWYDKNGRLLDEVSLTDPPLVFECNRACRCWVNCNNRVVQNGITCRLQLFKTNGRGWGVRTLMDVPKGTFVCEYIGELISDSEADRREDDSYLFDLDNKDGDTYCIDARRYGNISRFINHLCEPNLIPVKVFVEHQDLRFPRICLFASRDIQAYEELGFDYGEKFWIIKWKHFTCACKSTKCKYSSETITKTLEDYKLRYPDEYVDS